MISTGWDNPANLIEMKSHMLRRSTSLWMKVAAIIVGTVVLAGCQESSVPKQLKPIPASLSEKIRDMKMSETGPIFIRIFKESSELEVWKEKRDGKYALLKTYNICRWSGKLGPKIAEGDRQAPEGFYTVTPGQMNPKSSYYLAFNIGFPNTFDRAHGRTGSHLMVHGACSSAGCYSMTDEDAGELFALARDSFRGGQRAFQIQAFPFRMTPENMAKHRDNPNIAFWKMLKVGSDHFELSRMPPKVDVCGKQYVFNADSGSRKFNSTDACPAYTVPADLQVAVAAKTAADEAKMNEAVNQIALDAQKAAEDQRIAEDNRLAAAARAAEKQAAKEARAKQISEKLGIFGRILGRDKEEEATAAAAPPAPVVSSESSVAAFAPASAPVPKAKPAAKPVTTGSTTVPSTASASSGPTTPAPPAAVPASEADAEPAITPEMTPGIPSVGRFIKKKFQWFDGEPSNAAGETPG